MIGFDVLYYCKRSSEEGIRNELNEREAYYINYYLPPLNKLIPEHKQFEKQKSLINEINTIEEAIELAKSFPQFAEV